MFIDDKIFYLMVIVMLILFIWALIATISLSKKKTSAFRYATEKNSWV